MNKRLQRNNWDIKLAVIAICLFILAGTLACAWQEQPPKQCWHGHHWKTCEPKPGPTPPVTAVTGATGATGQTGATGPAGETKTVVVQPSASLDVVRTCRSLRIAVLGSSNLAAVKVYVDGRKTGTSQPKSRIVHYNLGRGSHTLRIELTYSDRPAETTKARFQQGVCKKRTATRHATPRNTG